MGLLFQDGGTLLHQADIQLQIAAGSSVLGGILRLQSVLLVSICKGNVQTMRGSQSIKPVQIAYAVLSRSIKEKFTWMIPQRGDQQYLG